MKKVKAICIDPSIKEVRVARISVDDEGSIYEDACSLISKHHDSERILTSLRVDQNHILWLDDEGVFVDWDKQGFFRLCRSGKCSQPIAGVALLTRIDGQDIDADVVNPLLHLNTDVEWLDPKKVRMEAPSLVTTDSNGEKQITHLMGVEFWDYSTQPAHATPDSN
jgi:hypothetical protein